MAKKQQHQEPFDHQVEGAADATHTGDQVQIPVHEEELTAKKRTRELGEVQIEKDVVSERKTVEAPVTEERVRVERHAVDRPVDNADAAFQDEKIEVPVRGEELEVHKQAKVAEEIEVQKEAVQRTEQVEGTVRHEEVHVGKEVDGDAARHD